MNSSTAAHKTGERLHFRPTPERAPFGANIPEGVVTVVEVVDHGAATAHASRFTYVVQTADGQRQGTDDRELFELCADCDAEAVRVSAPEYSAGVDGAPKRRCERHARPLEFADYKPSALVREQIEHAAHAVAGRLHAWRMAILSVVAVGVQFETDGLGIAVSRAQIMAWLSERVDELNVI